MTAREKSISTSARGAAKKTAIPETTSDSEITRREILTGLGAFVARAKSAPLFGPEALLLNNFKAVRNHR